MFSLAELEEIIPLVRTSVPPTPQYAWPLLKAQTGVEVVVKHENHTPIGAFKVRGGIVYFDRLKRERPQAQGVVTATRGNHGQSLAFAGERAGIAVTIVVPHGNSTAKNAAMRSLGADLAIDVVCTGWEGPAEAADDISRLLAAVAPAGGNLSLDTDADGRLRARLRLPLIG